MFLHPVIFWSKSQYEPMSNATAEFYF